MILNLDPSGSGEWRLWWRGLRTGISPADKTLTACIEELVASIARMRWRDDHGQKLLVHPPSQCWGQPCAIHDPSPHAMSRFKRLWRDDRKLMERVCDHGVGHPDPDHLSHVARIRGDRAAQIESVHGCDGCCMEHNPNREARSES